MAKQPKVETPNEEADLKLCMEYRETLGLPKERNFQNMECGWGFYCYEKGCPVPHRAKNGQRKTVTAKHSVKKLNKSKEKKNEIGFELQSFLWMQARVIEMLSNNPEFYRALDHLTVSEIRDRLIGPSGLEGVPASLGGNMQPTVTKATNKWFAEMEEKFAAEDEHEESVDNKEPSKKKKEKKK